MKIKGYQPILHALTKIIFIHCTSFWYKIQEMTRIIDGRGSNHMGFVAHRVGTAAAFLWVFLFHWKTLISQFNPYLLSTLHKNKRFWEELIAYFLWFDADRIEKDAPYNYSIVACIFVPAITFSPSCCLATYTKRHTDWWEGFMKYAATLGSGVMIYTPSFIKIVSTIQNSTGEGNTQRHRQEG
jgi:hypothetical protein